MINARAHHGGSNRKLHFKTTARPAVIIPQLGVVNGIISASRSLCVLDMWGEGEGGVGGGGGRGGVLEGSLADMLSNNYPQKNEYQVASILFTNLGIFCVFRITTSIYL